MARKCVTTPATFFGRKFLHGLLTGISLLACLPPLALGEEVGQVGRGRPPQQRRSAQQFQKYLQRMRVEEEKKQDGETRAQLRPNPTSPALHTAVALGQMEEVRTLIAAGKSVNEPDPVNGWKPLHYAACFNQAEAAKYLLDCKASVNLGTGSAHILPIHIAAISESDEVLQLLLLRGASRDAETSGGATALHFSAGCFDLDGVLLMLANGARADIKGTDGATVFAYVEDGFQAALKTHREGHELLAPKPVQMPNVVGQPCARCDGSGRRSPQEMRRLASAGAAQNTGTGAITIIPSTYPDCGGIGRTYSGEEKRVLEAAKAEQNRRQAQFDNAQQAVDQPIISTRNLMVGALMAFGGAGPAGDLKTNDVRAVREFVLSKYKGSAWTPPKPEPQPAAPSTALIARPSTVAPTETPAPTKTLGPPNLAAVQADSTSSHPLPVVSPTTQMVGNGKVQTPSAPPKPSGSGNVIQGTPPPTLIPPQNAATTLAELQRLTFADLRVTCEWAKLDHNAKLYSPVNSKNAGAEFGAFPPELAGRSFTRLPMHNTMQEAKLSFTVTSDGVVIFAVQSWRGGGSGGDWEKECVDADGLKQQG